MMAAREVVKFSPKGNYLIHSSVDGIIKVWETRTGTLKDEFTPSSHLAATCSCLAWYPSIRSPENLPKSKKRKKSLDETSTAESLDLVALGTAAGNVLLYSALKGDIHSRLENGHSLIINDICWHPERNVLYTCSSDQYIAEWDLSLGKVNHKWKASKNILQSICLPSKNTLISAGNLIKLWDLDKYEIIKKFNGHATEVLQLLPVVTDPKHESSYFLSAAVNDRLISAWAINSNKHDKNAIASFSLPDEPKTLALSNLKDQTVCLSVVTKSGELLIFEHILNGKMKKPICPKLTIKVVSSSGKTLPILVSYPTQDQNGTILLTHSSFIKPIFERVASKNMTGEVIIEHKPSLSSQFSSSNVQKVIAGEVSKDTTILTPSHMVSSGPRVENNTSFSNKRKRKSEFQLSLQERLKAISYDQSVEVPTTNQPPVADSMAVLLTQGLTSADRSILDNVLRKEHNEAIIQNTVRKLNIQTVVPLIKELSRRMSTPHLVLPIYVQWVKVVLSIHTSYLMSFPDLIDSLSSLHRLLDTRVTMFSKLTRLQGKLGLLLSQLTSRHQDGQEDSHQEQHPLLVYQDASSDEEMYFKKNLDDTACESESEYDWNTSDEEDDSESAKPDERDESD